MQFKVSDQRKMPQGLEPSLTSEALRPPQYYEAIRKQKLALSSLSLVEGRREKDKFLKAHASDKLRSNLAEANLQTRIHSTQHDRVIKVNDHDVVTQLRRQRVPSIEPYTEGRSQKSLNEKKASSGWVSQDNLQ